MMRWNSLLLVAGAAILAGTTSTASAQRPTRRTRSTVRIPVTKETTAAAQVETVTVTRVDTVRVPGPTDTVTRTVTDTVTRVDTMMTPIRIPATSPFYIGLAAGAALPAPNYSNVDKPGWRVEVPIGIDFTGSPFGIRADVGYGTNSAHDWISNQVGSASMLNVDADLKLAVPAVTPMNVRVQPYFLGGFSWDRFKNIAELDPNTGIYGVPDSNWHSGAGWNVGMGADIGHFFVETRFSRVSGVVDKISTVPVLVGIRF